MDETGKRKLKVDLSEIADAFDDNSGLVTYYLDLETGQVVAVTEETTNLLETIYHEYFHEQTEMVDWEAAYAAHRVPDWQRQDLQEAHAVERGGDTRFIRIPTTSSNEGYEDMAEFIETVKVRDIRSELKEAISGRSAFRRFKDALLNYPEVRQAWFDFKQETLEARARDWLELEEIEPIGGPDEAGAQRKA